MSIFNSLGSNYNLQYVFKSLFSDASGQNQKLKNYLEEKYRGKTILLYKGREALTLALKILNLPKESCVAINGFTCYAVYKAIEIAGYTPICLDLEEKKSDLNFTPEILKKSLEENKNIKVVVIQNTLGYPCNIKEIERICKENNLILIEDLAHCVGTRYSDGREAGTVGDFVTLSFSQDKIIDAVSGGALIVRNKKFQNNNLASPDTVWHLASQDQVLEPKFKMPKNQLKDKFYPLFTYKIRFLYSVGPGKLLHYVLRDLDLLSKPMQEGLYDFYSLPNWYCNLAVIKFNNLKQELDHRKEISKIYAKNLNKRVLNPNIINKVFSSTNLRFPIFVENRGDLIKFLKNSKIFVSDIWYFSVAPECPNAIEISHKILNLPTHINVTKKSALKISERINAWIKLQ